MQIGERAHPTVTEVLARIEQSGPRLSLNEKYILRTAVIRADRQEARIAAENRGRKQAWHLADHQ